MKKVVIKIGGSVMEDLDASFFTECASLVNHGWWPIIVHGGGPSINRIQESLGQAPVFAKGLRVTDDACLETVEMVLGGSVNKTLVSRLQQAGAKAVGISGVDGPLLEVSQKDPELGWVGEVEDVHTQLLETLLAGGWLPVVASLGTDGCGHRFNVNADTAAGAIAGALHAERLMLVTDVPGVLDRQGSLLSEVTPGRIATMVKDKEIYGGMIPKVKAALTGLDYVQEVVITDGRQDYPFSRIEKGIPGGTRIVKEEKEDGLISNLSKK
ncbi:N-acetylglutamate kinase [Marininema mesophilum]|uniref:Acetylglutamate kinase n=1 Tax=Marininema mesophilum TaxID=1048340 RepID=A0A1H2TK02_9BACL|nr:acetylglutamate kinase [Marininema mesophilum]SDW44283.1 N-acetylglutamate kinase [Marininema mesophilum]